MSRMEFDAESAVLKCILVDPDAYWRIADIIGPEDFQSADMRRLFALTAAEIKAGRGSDEVTIGELQHDLGLLAGDICSNSLGSPRNVRTYAELMCKRATERKVKQAGQRIANLTGEDILGEAQKILGACVPRETSSMSTLSEFAELALRGITERANHDSSITGTPTGFEELDDLTGGWQRTNLIVIAARPSVGKTAFALQSALHAAAQHLPCLFVTLEMSGVELTERAISHLGGVDSLHIRDSKKLTEMEWPQLQVAKRLIDELPFRVHETGHTIDAICAKARQIDAEQRLSLVVIDYLTYIKPSGKTENTTEALQEITRTLKSLAKELRVPVILLSQLSREGTDEPALHHLRGSGAIEQDADVVMFLHRPDNNNRNLVKATVAKQRNGPLGEFYLAADMPRMRFTSTDYEPAQRKVVGFGDLKVKTSPRARAVAND